MRHRVGSRLLSAAKFVRQGAYFADVGTDHAYLPLFLLSEGVIDRAVCSDINLGPLASARRNAEEEGVADKIIFKLSDGAGELSGMGITDYAICGMGGELIAAIIDRAPHLCDSGVNLILQPMTRASELRRFLFSHGFYIKEESYSYEAGKYYLCLLASYDGISRQISDFDAEFGMIDPRVEFSPEMQGYMNAKLFALKKAKAGKEKGGDSGEYESLLILEYERRILKGK